MIRSWLAIFALISFVISPPTVLFCTYPPLTEATIEDIAIGLEDGCFTSADLVKAYIARITETNDHLKAVSEINPDALSIAAHLDAQRRHGTVKRPLHGIPILIKDNIATADKMNNTSGSYALLGARVPRDSPTISRLRNAGAIIFGKTNMSEWAQFRSHSNTGTSGWSAITGQTYGAYHLFQDPYGSSSGSGVATSIGLALATLWDKDSWEYRNAFKSRELRWDQANCWSHIEAFGYSDISAPRYSISNYADLAGLRIGIPRNGIILNIGFGPVNETYILSVFEEALSTLSDLGAQIVDNTNFSSRIVAVYSHETNTISNEVTTIGSGFTSDIASYLSQLTHNPNDLTSLSSILNFTRHDPLEAYPDRDTNTWDDAISLDFDSSHIRAYKAHRASLALDESGGVTGTLKRYNLEALVIPTSWAPAWTASAGLPSIIVPLGAYPDGTPVILGKRELVAVGAGIPFGLSILVPRWSEEVLIRISYGFEQATLVRDRARIVFLLIPPRGRGLLMF